MTLFSQTINTSNQDAHEQDNGSGFSSTASIMYIQNATAAGSRRHSGIVVTNVTIPAGATIDSAYVKLYASSTTYDDMDCTIYGQDVDDADDFSTTADVKDRVDNDSTTANVTWLNTAAGTGQITSPDIASVIQEIIDRGGWSSGNNICILLVASASGTNEYRARTADYGSNYPVVEINYTPASTGNLLGAEAIFDPFNLQGI